MKSEKIIIAVILGVAMLGYAFIGRQTKLDLAESKRVVQEQEATARKQEEQNRADKLRGCLQTAGIRKHTWWTNSCENHGYNIEKNEDGVITTCSLPSYNSDLINKTEREDRDRCVKLYQ